MGQMIEISADTPQFKGYLALPAAGRGPGLVLCQEIFGVNANMQALADVYAEEGYMVLVPDLFWRLQPGIVLTDAAEDMPKALGYYQRFDEAAGMQDVQAAIHCLRAMTGAYGQVGVLGFCLGGKLAYLAASQTDADVAVAYYGVGIEHALAQMAAIRCPLSLHIAVNDGFCPAPAQEAILAAAQSQPRVKTYVYADVDHAFARLGGAHYHAPSAQMAYSRTLATLRWNLPPAMPMPP